MKALGYDKPLYILPFDHRHSFQTKLFGWIGNMNADQTAQIAAASLAGFQVITPGRFWVFTEAKALLRYNPGGDGPLNARQAARLKRLSD